MFDFIGRSRREKDLLKTARIEFHLFSPQKGRGCVASQISEMCQSDVFSIHTQKKPQTIECIMMLKCELC